MKKRIFAFLTVIFLITLAVPVFAVSDGNYIIDTVGYFYEDELANLNQKADEIYNNTHYNIMFSITDNTGDLSLYDYIENQYNTSCQGENGLILGYDTEKNKWIIYFSGDANSIFTEDDEYKLWDAFVKPETISDGVYEYMSLAESYLPVYEKPADISGIRLIDSAGLLTKSQRSNIKNKLDEISNKHNCDIVIVTVNTLSGKTPMVYADDFFDYNGYSENGILLLISMEDRDWYISTAGNGISAVTDAGWQYIGDEIVEYLSDGDYNGAFKRYADLCDDFLTHREETGEPYNKGNLPKKPLSSMWYLYSLVGGAIIALIITGIMKSDLKSVEWKSAGNYLKNGSLKVTESKDIFLYSHIDRERKPDESSSSSTSTHTSSSGASHGGGGGKF